MSPAGQGSSSGITAAQFGKKGSCTDDVAVSPKQHYFRTIINVGKPPHGIKAASPCELAKDFSEIVVETLKT